MRDHGLVYHNPDSYCGPISMLLRLPDDETLLVFREARFRPARRHTGTHFDPTTRTSLLRSRDRGRSWFSLVTPDSQGGNGTSLARLSDGTLLFNGFHWLFAPAEQRDTLADRARLEWVEWANQYVAMGEVHITRSTTDGYTWEPLTVVHRPAEWAMMTCAGRVVELPDGDLLMPMSASRTAQRGDSQGLILRSRDQGHTWGEPTLLTGDATRAHSYSESRLVLTATGRLLALHRTEDGNYFQNHSTDAGRTWSATHDTGIWCGASSPPDLLQLRDGRLLLTRGYRREPFGVRYHLSEDDGRTWNAGGILRDDGQSRDVGYPSTVEYPDGELLTVYYWRDADDIRHLQRTVWRLDGGTAH